MKAFINLQMSTEWWLVPQLRFSFGWFLSRATIYWSNLTLKILKHVLNLGKNVRQSGLPPPSSHCFDTNNYSRCSSSIVYRFVLLLATNFHIYLSCFNVIFRITFPFRPLFSYLLLSFSLPCPYFRSNMIENSLPYRKSRRRITQICHKNFNLYNGAKRTTMW